MSDAQNNNGNEGLVTITSEDIQALSTNGTNEIVSPDSPKKGHLFILNTTVAEDGEMEIQRTLIDQGEKNDLDDASEATDSQVHDGNQNLKDHQKIDREQLETISEHKNEIQKAQSQNETMESKPENELTNPNERHKSDAQEYIDEPKTGVQESGPQPTLTHEQQEVVEKHKIEEIESSKEKNEQETSKSEGSNVVQETHETPINTEVSTAELSNSKAEAKKKKPKRTLTTPASGSFKLLWQKKHVEDDAALEDHTKAFKEHPEVESNAENIEGSKTAVIAIPPLSGVMKNLKKGLKIKVGGSSKSRDDSAPDRIQQKSGARPSPRIVSSLNISPTYQSDVPAQPDSPGARKRKEIEEILSVMPPSPKPMETADSTGHAHIYDNLPQGEKHNGQSLATPSEEEIQPSIATKPVFATIEQAVNEQKALSFLESLHPDTMNGTNDKPPRPPPAKDDSPTKTAPRNLPPPPRPPAPKVGLQKSYTMTVSQANRSQNDDVIMPVVSTHEVHSTPVQMRSSYQASTASLDRRKLYRSKAENRIAKRATLSRPMTLHETTFTLKRKPNEEWNTSFDGSSMRPKSQGAKIVYEQRDSITLPKFLLGIKKKALPPPVTRPQLPVSPTTKSEGAEALRSIATSEDGNFISPVTSSVQQSAPMIRSVQTTSVAIQTIPQKSKAPISSLRHGTEHPTLLSLATNPKVLEGGPKNTPFEEAFFANKIKPLLKEEDSGAFPSESVNNESPIKLPPASPPAGYEVPIPYIGERIISETEDLEKEPSSLFAFQHSHRVWSEGHEKDDFEESASEKLVTRCLQEYMAACCRLRSVDLQGEFAAFHWQYGDLDDAGWIRKGVIAGYNDLEVYNDPAKHIDFVKLPPIQKTVGSLIYPEKTIDSMLSTWIDIGRTHVATTPSRSDGEHEPVFHPAVAIIRLYDLIQEMSKSEKSFQRLLPSLVLAVLLSIDQCTANLPQSVEDDKKFVLNLNPADIILLSSPANCLVLFRIADSEGDWNIQRLLLEMYPDYADSLQVGVKGCFENLSEAAKAKLYLPALLEAVAPPDWVVQTIARIALGKGENFSPSQDGI